MTFQDSIKNSDSILIEGDKKVGKFTFSIFECSKEKIESILVFSTYNKTVMEKRINAIKYLNIKTLNKTLNNLKLLCLKENFLELKARFGIDFLLKDIKRAIEKHNPKAVIFHRFDIFFEFHETGNLKYFMEEIMDLKNEFNLKLFFTTANLDSNRPIIENMENFTDMNLIINRTNNKRIISVKNSLYPTNPDKCEFVFYNNDAELIPIGENQETNNNVYKNNLDKYNILIITQKEELKKTLAYIFKKDIFNIESASTTSEIINKLLKNPDIVIYNPFDKEMDFSVCHTIKEQKLKSKLIYITNENYIRGDDKIAAISNGCYEVFPYNFNLLEFIAEIEKLLGMNFYTYTLSKISSNREITNKKTLCQILETLYKEKFFFTVLKLKSLTEIKKEYLRKTDFIYKEKDEYILILLNTRIIHIPYIIKKFFKNSEEFDLIYAYEAPDYPLKKEEICK
jgi:hypothetical protein